MSTVGSSTSSYWCYRCNRSVIIQTHLQDSSLSCLDCSGGFIEQIPSPTRLPGGPPGSDLYQTRFPAAAMYMGSQSPGSNPSPPVGTGFELFYDDGSVSGLRPLPASMSEILLGSGFDRLLDQLAQIESNGLGRIDNNLPASKAAIEAMPTIEIEENHVVVESYCAVCKEPFELGSEAKEMPCEHLYHPDCILPWLALRNSCLVCRHELPTDAVDASSPSGGHGGGNVNNQLGNEEEAAGLTIWRLPGGGFAVGRFSGGRRGGERELPVVFTEMDGEGEIGGIKDLQSRRLKKRSNEDMGLGFYLGFITSLAEKDGFTLTCYACEAI